jgi:alpha-ketoglutarate-dependent dioxygenase FTO
MFYDMNTDVLVITGVGDAYLMMYNINATHQHAVIAGRYPRYSSTHRKALREGATYDWISDRAIKALALFRSSCACHICHIAMHHGITPASTSSSSSSSSPQQWMSEPLTLSSHDAKSDLTSAIVGHIEMVHNEVEFEWLRQFWCQGAHSASLHFWWRPRIEALEALWRQFELVV